MASQRVLDINKTLVSRHPSGSGRVESMLDRNYTSMCAYDMLIKGHINTSVRSFNNLKMSSR